MAGSLDIGHPIIPVTQFHREFRIPGANYNKESRFHANPLHDFNLPEQKTGGKVSRYKGGKVKKAQSQKKKTKKTYDGHHGSKYVAKLYK